MAITRQTMTDEQRKSVALEYLNAFDNAGVTSTRGSILDLFAEDAQVFFPKWGIANGRDLHPMQTAFRDHHALQCGYCTAGIVMNAIDLVKRHPNPSEESVRAALEGNFCRCTGYHNIVKAVLAGAAAMK